MKKRPQTERPSVAPAAVDSRFLRTLVGYNTRRVTLKVFELFAQRMASLALSPVEFSVLLLVGHNPGLMPSQLCAELVLLPPNLTRILARLDQRQLLLRTPAAADKRAVCLSLSAAGLTLLAQAQQQVAALEADASAMLTDKERQTLLQLLQKIYR
jgi:DNA-binding MarR family transcriptional regulator